MNCYYCQKNAALDKEIINPHTKEIHPTCAVCEYSFELLRKDLKKYKILKGLGNLSLLISIIGLIVYGWLIAMLCIIVGLGLKFLFHIMVGNNASTREKLEGQFADGKGLFSFHSKNKNS